MYFQVLICSQLLTGHIVDFFRNCFSESLVVDHMLRVSTLAIGLSNKKKFEK